jgi:hypothetical protein
MTEGRVATEAVADLMQSMVMGRREVLNHNELGNDARSL